MVRLESAEYDDLDGSTQPSGASDDGSIGLKSVRKMTSEVRNVSHVGSGSLGVYAK